MTSCVGCAKQVVIRIDKQDPKLCYDCWFLEVEKSWSGC